MKFALYRNGGTYMNVLELYIKDLLKNGITETGNSDIKNEITNRLDDLGIEYEATMDEYFQYTIYLKHNLCRTVWNCYDESLEGKYSYYDLYCLWNNEADKTIYDNFSSWIEEMEQCKVLVRERM